MGTEAPHHADLFSLRCHHNPLEHVQHIFSFGERQAYLLRLKLAIGTLELTDFELSVSSQSVVISTRIVIFIPTSGAAMTAGILGGLRKNPNVFNAPAQC